VLIDGAGAGSDATFTLKPSPGDETAMSIKLVGATGDSCVVRISEVDGGSEPDLLICQISDPAPVHLYRFIVTPPSALDAMARATPRRAAARESEEAKAPGRAARKQAKKPAKRKAAAKSGRARTQSSTRRGR
jgi:hypothetical protein